jgi:hypothetical protein
MRKGLGINQRAIGTVLVIATSLISPFRLAAQDAITANCPRFNWQPTQAPPGTRYVGNRACASCHPAEVATQPLTPMGKALEPVSQCAILRAHPILTTRTGHYSYRIVTRGGRSVYAVTDGVTTLSEPIEWAFGQGQPARPMFISVVEATTRAVSVSSVTLRSLI